MMCLFWDSNLINTFKKVSITICIVCVSFFSFAQSQTHFFDSSATFFPQFTMSPLPDTIDYDDKKDGEYTFAYPFFVHISKDDIKPLQIGDSLIYAFSIQSDGAYSLNLIFEQVQIPSGAYLSVYSKKSENRIVFSPIESGITAILPTPLLQGDNVFVRYVEPLQTSTKGSWILTQVSHDYKNIMHYSTGLKSTSASCNVDINCALGQSWQNEKQSVCKLIIQGITMCTGTLIGNTSKDNTPYVVTANHCVPSNTQALKTVFYFNYENSECGNDASKTSPYTISGSSLIATSPDTKVDFALLKMNKIPPKSYKPYYAGWTTSTIIENGAICIHHPKGDVKKISVDNGKVTSTTFKTVEQTYATNGHWRVADWEFGTTEGGSSGSSLFNNNHLIIGTLSGGEADCSYSVNDYFSKFSMAWDYYEGTQYRLQPWLDPFNSNATMCSGYDPYFLPTNVATNVSNIDTLHVFDFGEKADGLWSGVNELGWQMFAERFFLNQSIYDVNICGKIDTTQDLSNVRFVIWTGSTSPETEVYSIPMTKSMLQDSIWVHFEMPEPIAINGNCWVGYEIANNSTAFSGFMSQVDAVGTAYVRHSKGWVNTEDIGLPAHYGVSLHVTEIPDTLQTISFEKPFFANKISNTLVTEATDALFSIDSLGAIKRTTPFYTVSEKSVSNLSGANELKATCFANKIELSYPTYVRGIKIAVASIPNNSKTTDVVVWNSDLTKELTRKTISNALLKSKYFNQIHLDSLLYIDTTFYYGICIDTAEYEENLSAYLYNDTESLVDGYFYFDTVWLSYANYELMYNVGVQPIIAKSKYHFNPDSASVLQYPLLYTSKRTVSQSPGVVLYPTICNNEFSLQFKVKVYTSIHVSLVDAVGNVVSSGEYTMQNGKFIIPISKLARGMYNVRIVADGDSYEGKILHIQ